MSSISKGKPVESINAKCYLNYEEFCNLLSSGGAYLFDVRNATEVLNGSIPGSVNIPLNEVKKALSLSDGEFKELYGIQKPKYSDENIIFYGLSDVSASAACEIAHNLGYKRSKYYLKGWSEWTERHSKK